MSTRGAYRRRPYRPRGVRSRSRRSGFMVGRQRSIYYHTSGRVTVGNSDTQDWRSENLINASAVEIVKVHHMELTICGTGSITDETTLLRGRAAMINVNAFEGDNLTEFVAQLNSTNNPTISRAYGHMAIMGNQKAFPIYQQRIPGAKILQRDTSIRLLLKNDNGIEDWQYIFTARAEPVDVRNAV